MAKISGPFVFTVAIPPIELHRQLIAWHLPLANTLYSPMTNTRRRVERADD